MRLRHMRGVGAVVAVVGLVLAGFPAGAADTPGTLVIGLDQEPPTLDPHASPSAVTYQIIASVTECLLYKAPDGELSPWLAGSWAPSQGRRSGPFKLRRDVKFDDGTSVDTRAV